jgi:peroxiredoxin
MRAKVPYVFLSSYNHPTSPNFNVYRIPKANPSSPNTEWANKRVVLFAVPGAFTPSCSVKHLPGYIQNLPALKSKGVDIIAVIAFNDAWVMSAWGKANGIKDDSIASFLSTPPFSSLTLYYLLICRCVILMNV